MPSGIRLQPGVRYVLRRCPARPQAHRETWSRLRAPLLPRRTRPGIFMSFSCWGFVEGLVLRKGHQDKGRCFIPLPCTWPLPQSVSVCSDRVGVQQVSEIVSSLVCIQFICLWSAAFFFSSPQLGFSPVHRPGSADGKQPRSCAHELPAGHIPAACTVIPPRALSLQNQFSERKRKEKIRDRAIYPTKSGKGRYRQITLIIITNNSNNAKLLSPCGAGRCLASCVDYFTLDQVSF